MITEQHNPHTIMSYLKIGHFYHIIEEAIMPIGQIEESLFQLKEINSETSIVFIVLCTNHLDFCDPNLNIADISVWTKYCLTVPRVMIREVEVEDFPLFLDSFPKLKKEWDIYYDDRFFEYLKGVKE